MAGLKAELTVKTGEKDVVYVSLRVQKHPLLPCCLHCWTVNHILFNLPFASSVLKEALLITSYQFELQLSFGFPNFLCILGLCFCISAGQPIVTSTSVYLSVGVWDQSGVPQSSVLAFCHACCNFCLSERTDFFTLRRLSLKIKEHTWVPWGGQDRISLVKFCWDIP